MYKNRIKTILYHGERNNPNAKVVDSNFRGKVSEEIKKAKMHLKQYCNNDGCITEGSKSNIFMIKEISYTLQTLEASITRSDKREKL